MDSGKNRPGCGYRGRVWSRRLLAPPVKGGNERASERRRRGRFLLGINEARLTADLSALAHPRQTVTAEKKQKKTQRTDATMQGREEKKKKRQMLE